MPDVCVNLIQKDVFGRKLFPKPSGKQKPRILTCIYIGSWKLPKTNSKGFNECFRKKRIFSSMDKYECEPFWSKVVNRHLNDMS